MSKRKQTAAGKRRQTSGAAALRYPVRALLPVAAAAGLALFGAVDSFQRLREYSRNFNDPYFIGAQESRLREVAALLPPGAVAGYLSDLPFDDPRGAAAFYVAQYALAPHILVRDDHPHPHDWVLAQYLEPPDLVRLQQERGFLLVRQIGPGQLLLRRKPR